MEQPGVLILNYKQVWDMYAYLCRYGKQPISEIRKLTANQVFAFMEAISRIVKDENPKNQKGH